MAVDTFDITIKVMTAADVDFAICMTDIERWGNRPEDFQRLIAFEPEGCFVAWRRGERIGMVTTTSYDDYGFLGGLIVPSANRGEGLGARLMQHAIDYLTAKGVRTIELDAAQLAIPLYRRLGFKDKYLSLRFFRPAHRAIAGRTGLPDVSTAPLDIDQLAAFDLNMTGLVRERILRRFADEFGPPVHVSDEDSISAYAFVRPIKDDCCAIGPIVSTSLPSAVAVMDGIINRYSDNGLSIGVLEITNALRSILLSMGFVYREPSLRMYFGEERTYERNIFAILSPEKG